METLMKHMAEGGDILAIGDCATFDAMLGML
jgi:hypothetical protein